jgi:hypothetical protein
MTAATDVVGLHRDRVTTRRVRTRLDAFPRRAGRRWLLRLAFATPFLIVAGIAGASPAVGALPTPNQALIDRVTEIPWGDLQVAWIGQLYPPISTVIAALVPSRVGLAVLGALVAGALLQKVLETLVQRHVVPSTTTLLMLALAANPLFFYTALENFAGFLGLAFFGLAISDLMRFTVWGNTQSGFRAGLWLMLAALAAPSGLLYVAAAVLAGLFVDLQRHGERGVRAANALVTVFPTVAAFGTLFLLDWAFTGSILGTAAAQVVDGWEERFAQLGAFAIAPRGWLLLAPVLCAWTVALIVRRPRAIIVSSLVFIAIVVAFVVGVLPENSAGNTQILMTLLAIALIPTATTVGRIIAIDIIAVAMLSIAWLAALERPIVIEWITALGGVFGVG